VIVKIENDKVLSEDNLNENERKRILAAYKEAKEKRDWDLSGNRFYLLDKIYETEYNKISPGGMRGKQYFDLGNILGSETLPDIEEIAALLKDKKWE